MSLINNLWARRAAWAVATLLLLSLLSWLAVPPLLKWQAQLRLGEALGRGVTIGKVDFKPWALALAVDELVIAGAAPASRRGPPFPIGSTSAAPGAQGAVTPPRNR